MTDLGRPEASVVIPTRGRWHLLRRTALPSALGQRQVEHEVIVVDDGSADETAERLQAIHDPRLRVIRHASPLGVSRARNAGIAAARGRWVSFLDDDDVWAPTKLRRQIDEAEARDAVFVYASGAALDGELAFLFAVAAPDPATVTCQLLRWNVIWCGCSNVAARLDVVRELGGFDEGLSQLADWDLWIRLSLAGPAAAVPEVLVGYVMHAESMLLTERKDVFPELERLSAKHREAARAHGVELDRARFARWVARGHRRAGRRWEAARTYLGAALRHGDLGSGIRALASLAPESAVPVGQRLLRTERASLHRTIAVPEPEWVRALRRDAVPIS